MTKVIKEGLGRTSRTADDPMESRRVGATQKWIKDLNVSPESIKLLEKHKRKASWHWPRRLFLRLETKDKQIKSQVDKQTITKVLHSEGHGLTG